MHTCSTKTKGVAPHLQNSFGNDGLPAKQPIERLLACVSIMIRAQHTNVSSCAQTIYNTTANLVCETAKTVCFLHMLTCLCARSKAWLAVRESLRLARTGMPRPARARCCVPCVRLRQSFSRTLLFDAIWRKHRGKT